MLSPAPGFSGILMGVDIERQQKWPGVVPRYAPFASPAYRLSCTKFNMQNINHGPNSGSQHRLEANYEALAHRKYQTGRISGSYCPPRAVCFAVLTYGDISTIDLRTWRFRIFWLVDEEVTLSWDEFMGLPQLAVTADFHCVTQWSRLDNLWEGVSFKGVAKLAKIKPEAGYVTFHCYGGYTTPLALDALMDEDVLFAHHHDGKPLATEHGGPMRVVVPKRYGWKSAKWVNGLEYIAQDRAGFWEQRGYSSNADPWKEERFCENLG